MKRRCVLISNYRQKYLREIPFIFSASIFIRGIFLLFISYILHKLKNQKFEIHR